MNQQAYWKKELEKATAKYEAAKSKAALKKWLRRMQECRMMLGKELG